MRIVEGPISVSPKTQGELLEAVKMMCGAVDGFPDIIAEPAIQACYAKACALVDQAMKEAIDEPRVDVFPTKMLDDQACVVCPICQCDWVHPESVRVTPPGKIGSGYIHVDARGVFMDAVGEPKGRGVEIRMAFHCEYGHSWVQTMHFHKGTTMIEAVGGDTPDFPQGPDGEPSGPHTIWRD